MRQWLDQVYPYFFEHELSLMGVSVRTEIYARTTDEQSADTQRGLRGRAERGVSTGGTPCGHRSEPVALDEKRRPVESAGFRKVVDDQAAAVLRRIFNLYLNGASLRDLAHRLNAEGFAPPGARAMEARSATSHRGRNPEESVRSRCLGPVEPDRRDGR